MDAVSQFKTRLYPKLCRVYMRLTLSERRESAYVLFRHSFNRVLFYFLDAPTLYAGNTTLLVVYERTRNISSETNADFRIEIRRHLAFPYHIEI